MEVSAHGMFKVQSSTCLKGLGKITEILSLNSQHPGRNSNSNQRLSKRN